MCLGMLRAAACDLTGRGDETAVSGEELLPFTDVIVNELLARSYWLMSGSGMATLGTTFFHG